MKAPEEGITTVFPRVGLRTHVSESRAREEILLEMQMRSHTCSECRILVGEWAGPGNLH